MQIVAAVLVLGLSFLLTNDAAALEPSDTDCITPKPSTRPAVTRSDLDKLIGWIALKTDYDLSSVYRDPPEIVFCQVGEVVDYETEGLLVDEILAAAYDFSRRRIYLVRPWTAVEPFDLSVLLHELIHAAQLDNRNWPCPGAPELEAYTLQSIWLQEQGIIRGFDWSTIHKLSQCPTGTGN
mgnify:CR=1 FL=1